MLNKIQNTILAQFLKNPELKYSEAQFKEIDHDLFNYHLRFLLDKGYIQKVEKNYTLTTLGKKYAHRLDIKGNFKQYFKVSVLVYLLDIHSPIQQILLHKRLRHPYYGDIATIAGTVSEGEKILDVGHRKLLEETGLSCSDLKVIGIHRKIRRKNSEIFEDTFYHVLIGTQYSGNLNSTTEFGENFWCSFDQAISLQDANITKSPKSIELIKKLQVHDFTWFYWEEDVSMNKV